MKYDTFLFVATVTTEAQIQVLKNVCILVMNFCTKKKNFVQWMLTLSTPPAPFSNKCFTTSALQVFFATYNGVF